MDNIDKELLVTVVMNDGSVLNEAKLGFLDEFGYFDWITDINVLKSILNNQMDKRLIAFGTQYVQGKIIKQNIKNISISP